MQSKTIQEEVLQLAQQLITFRSVSNDQEQIALIVDFCVEYFRGSEAIIKRHEKNQRPSLVILTHGTNTPDIFLVGHLDVVDAQYEKTFEPTVIDDKLYGRGAIDMKSQVAIMMRAMKGVLEGSIKTGCSVGLMLTTDEEIGSRDGVDYLVNEIGYRSKVAIVPDGGSEFRIVTAEKGAIFFKVVMEGKSAHGSRPWRGENAIEKLVSLYNNLLKEFPRSQDNDNDWGESISLNKITGGTALNQVPDRCEGYFDFRFTEEHSKEFWLQRLQDFVNNVGGRLESLVLADSSFTSPDNEYVKIYRSITEEVLGHAIELKNAFGGSDARFFSVKKIPTMISVPLGGNIHGKDEWVSIEALEQFYRIISKFISAIKYK